MNRTEASVLLGHCAAFDNRQPSEAAATAWASALHDIPLDQDTKDAVSAYYTTPPKDPDQRLWIMPHHVRTLRSKIRSKRLESFQYEPVEGESTAEYLARYRGQVQAIASGRHPAPTARLALEGGPSRELMAGLEARGWQGNRMVDDEQRSVEAELLDEVRRSGPLGLVCPTCQAAIGRPCKTPGGSEKQPLGKPRAKPHTARLRAASGRTSQTPEQRAAEEQRIREMSARHLARQQAEQDIPDAEIVEEAS
ncbi:zinc finger domain-containing protein [Streptomyces sp. NPDC004436]